MVKINRKPPKLSQKKRLEKYFKDALSDEQLFDLELMLNNSERIMDIVREMQESRGAFIGVSPRYLRDKIIEYNTHVVKPGITKKFKVSVPEYREALAIGGAVDVLKELSELALQQERRVDRAMDAERNSPRSREASSSARKEIKLMGDILQSYAKLQMDTGALRRAPKTISGEYINNDDEKDPYKITFKVTKEFLATLDEIGKELSDYEERISDLREDP
jgi:hypothetical protein